jgi:hypothetical protein
MSLQLGFAGFEQRKGQHKTSKEKFLGRMTDLIPWAMLEEVIEPYYPKRGNGRPPYPLSACYVTYKVYRTKKFYCWGRLGVME